MPDLQARIQVALFNILQEGDVQIRGFKFRLQLDTQFVFTANPEDYTNRGSIVTPLKDRIGSQILTHYPKSIELAKKITEQEARLTEAQQKSITIPELLKDLVEQVVMEARDNEYVDHKSGVSATTKYYGFGEFGVSIAERRCTPEHRDRKNDRYGLATSMASFRALRGRLKWCTRENRRVRTTWPTSLIGKAIRTLYSKGTCP